MSRFSLSAGFFFLVLFFFPARHRPFGMRTRTLEALGEGEASNERHTIAVGYYICADFTWLGLVNSTSGTVCTQNVDPVDSVGRACVARSGS